MMGSFAEAEDLVQDTLERAWKSAASEPERVDHWLFAIATHACLTALAKRKRTRLLPQLDLAPATDPVFGETEPERWITPAADARLFADPAAQAESRESVALAFIALLQRLPPRQRAALLMKDVLGWSSEGIAASLELSVGAVSSALFRARETLARSQVESDEPPPEALIDFVRAWESHDVDGLVALLRRDVVLAMPPHAVWFQGLDAVVRFLRSPRFSEFWSGGIRLAATRANRLPAFGFHRVLQNGRLQPHSVMVTRFVQGELAEMTVFVGPAYFAGFDISPGETAQFSGARGS